MAIASGASVSLSYVAESTHGVTPGSPAMKELRATSRSINPQKGLQQSAERRSNRQVQDLRHGFRQVNGSPAFELGMTDYDDMIEAAMSGNRTAGVTTGTATLDSVNAASAFTRASGSFVTDGFRKGDWVKPTGCGSQTEPWFLVTGVAATTLTVHPAPVDDTGGGDEVIAVQGRTMDIGSQLKTFTFERRFADIGQYQVFRGCAVNSLAVSIQPEQLVSCSMEVIGMSFAPMSGSSVGSPAAASYTAPFSSFDGGLYIDGAEAAVVTGLDFTINNGRALRPVLFNATSPEVFEGTAQVTGTLSFLLQDAALVSRFEEESEILLALRLEEFGDTGFHAVTMPRVKINGADIDPPQEGPVVVSAPFQALYSAAAGTSLRWQVSNAA